jgi:hypothetical protein
VSKLHCVKGYRRPEGKVACDILVDSGFTFQNFRVMDVVAKAEMSADSGSVQEYYPEHGGRFLLRNITCIHIVVVSLLRCLDCGSPGFDLGSVQVRFLVDKVALGQTSVFPCQHHSTVAPHFHSSIYKQHYIILAIDSVCEYCALIKLM